MRTRLLALLLSTLAVRSFGSPQGTISDGLPANAFGWLKARSIGPALTSGRITAFAVNPSNRSHYFAAAASGGVWKTVNAGASWSPVFDNEGSYSIGALAMDPRNPSVVWVGTGESNAQRSVGYGDGVYRTDDGGRSWRNVGLKRSEHIGRIVIDPRNTDTVYVAAQGPLWAPGSDRGLFKTTDGGKNWKNVLPISENTGVTDVVIDPRNPDVLFAAAWQRRRHVWTYIGGGPESAIYRSNDAGATWTRLRSGLPSEDLGRVGFALSADPTILYATVEAANSASGIYCTTDGGATWQKRGDFVAQGMYYGQIVADPKNPDRVVVLSVVNMVSDDGGRTFKPLGERNKHVDNHALWIDPNDTNYYLAGCDGGIYESFDRCQTWIYKPNLPITQFYDVTADTAAPFYMVYGGTQDNNSLGGPSRTRTGNIRNSDWFSTLGGDGFHQQVDPKDPNIVYSVLQYGGISRLNRATGERVGIQPQPGRGEPALRWNWDSPLLISPHNNKRIYFAANRLFRSDDSGSAWQPVSPDLSRQIDRNSLKVMGRVWKVDAVGKSQSTSFYGNITALDESPLREGLLYVGTDDGLIQVSEDGGKTWRRTEKFANVPDGTFTARIRASLHDASTVYAVFNNHKNGDFKPYIVRSADAGRTWETIAGNLPEAGPAWAFAQDPVKPDLLFAGTEYGVYFSLNGGKDWRRLRGGLPTIAVRDLHIQKQMSDLVVATFGRGIYIVDDFSPLRTISSGSLQSPAALLQASDAVSYQSKNLQAPWQGETQYSAENPPSGAAFTWFLKEAPKTLRQKRLDAEQAAEKAGMTPPYPTAEQLRAEQAEEAPALLITVADSRGTPVRRIFQPVAEGVQRTYWDLTADGERAVVEPGRYQASLSLRHAGETKPLTAFKEFTVSVEGFDLLSAADRSSLLDFRRKAVALGKRSASSQETTTSLLSRMAAILAALDRTPAAPPQLRTTARAITEKIKQVELALNGDSAASARQENTPPSISDRVGTVSFGQIYSFSMPTQTRREAYTIANSELDAVVKTLREILTKDLTRLEAELDKAGVPHTPGRLPAPK